MRHNLKISVSKEPQSGGILRVALAQGGRHGLEAVRQRADVLDHIEEEPHSTHRPHLPPAPR